MSLLVRIIKVESDLWTCYLEQYWIQACTTELKHWPLFLANRLIYKIKKKGSQNTSTRHIEVLHWPQGLCSSRCWQSKYGDSSHSTSSFSSRTSLKAWRCHQWLIQSCLLACRAARTEKPFPARCHSPEVSLQIWASESVVCSTSLHGSATGGIPGTQQLPGTKPGSLSLGLGPRYKAHFVQLSYSGVVKRRSQRNLDLAWHFHNCRNPAFTALKPYEFK